MSTHRHRAAANGFTLIEASVALAILALSLAAVYQVFGWTLRHAAQQRQRERAWLTAQSLLDQIRAERALEPGRRHGLTPLGLSWEARVERRANASNTAPISALPDATPTVAVLPATFEVTIEVSWGRPPNRRVQLRSIEFGASQ